MSGRRNSSIRSKVINILVIGYQKVKEPQKHQVFVLVVTWNNGERYETYRRYSDIFSFHTALKELFPIAAGRGEEERIIPQLPKINFVLRNQVTRVTEAKLEQYNLYCRTIISMDPSISESAHVLGFFSPRGGDKELPMLQFRRPMSASRQAVGEAAVTKNKEELDEHFALADFTAEDASQVSFKAGDKVFVKTKDESGWWLCKVNGQVGWAPPTFLKKKEAKVTIHVDSVDTERDDLERSSDSDGYIKVQPSFKHIVLPVVENYQDRASAVADFGPRENGRPPDVEVTTEEYITIESYQADGPGQVSFKDGEKAHVLDKLEDGWWFVSIGNQEGWAPCSYLERLNGEDDEEEETIITLDSIEKYYAVDDYEAVEDDEISFPEGAVVDVMQKRLDGWWLVRYEGQTGLAPGTFLRKGLPPGIADLPTITKNRESDSFPVPDSKGQEALAYENVQLQMMRAQPPRRKSMRQWVKSKNNYSQPRAPAVLPRQSSPQKKAAAGYINPQPHFLGADLNVEQEEAAAKCNTIGTTRELAVPQQEEKQLHGSIRETLQGRGGVKNRVKGFETDSPGGTKGQIPIMIKPNMPKARIRKQKPAQTGGGGGGEDRPQQAQPRIKPRTKLQKTSLNGPARDDSPPPPLPPRASRKSPPHVTSPTRRSPPNVTSPTRTRANEHFIVNHPSHYDVPPPLRPGHPSRSHDRSHDQSPPLGPGHPLRPDDEELPHNPPRPTASVIQRAKDNHRREKSPRLFVPSSSDDLDSVHTSSSSPATMSSRSYPRNRPRHKVKKTKSQTPADRFQDAYPSRGHQPVSRMRSDNVTTEDAYSTIEAPPQNGEVGGASGGGGGGIPFRDDFTAMLIKHILESNDPSLKAKLKNVLENNKDIRNSLADLLQ